VSPWGALTQWCCEGWLKCVQKRRRAVKRQIFKIKIIDYNYFFKCLYTHTRAALNIITFWACDLLISLWLMTLPSSQVHCGCIIHIFKTIFLPRWPHTGPKLWRLQVGWPAPARSLIGERLRGRAEGSGCRVKLEVVEGRGGGGREYSYHFPSTEPTSGGIWWAGFFPEAIVGSAGWALQTSRLHIRPTQVVNKGVLPEILWTCLSVVLSPWNELHCRERLLWSLNWMFSLCALQVCTMTSCTFSFLKCFAVCMNQQRVSYS